MKALSLAILVLASSVSYGATFMPENDLGSDKSAEATGITQAQFDDVINRTEAIYGPIVAAHGAKLTINHLWTDDTVNADSSQPVPTDWQVNMYGGLARRAEVTEDGFAMVLCHELGHHLGGYPFFGPTEWAAVEGQADTHATGACAYKVFGTNMELASRAEAALPADMKAKCDAEQPLNKDVCYRILAASQSLANLLAALEGTTVSFETPDQSKVTATNSDHPAAQCRLDTYVASALCGADLWDYALIPGKSQTDRNGAAAEREAFQHSCATGTGARPACWFAPGTVPTI